MIMVVLLVLGNLSISSSHVEAKGKIKSFNSLIEVGDAIYVQHDKNNKDIYDLKRSQTGTTVVYQQIFPEFTANKVWTSEGKFIQNVDTNEDGSFVSYGATAPNQYIPVKEGEKYFIKTYGVGTIANQMVTYTPVLFLDENNQKVADMLTNTFEKSKEGQVITVPKGATRMHLTNYNSSKFTLQRVLYLSDQEFSTLPSVCHKNTLEEEISTKYNEYVKDRIIYKNMDQAYITFVNDDTRAPLDQFADIFIAKKIPLVLATVPELLIENASSQKQTRLQVARRVAKAGGEIMAHYNETLTEEKISDYNKLYSVFVSTKQLLNHYNFDVNGIILSGGNGQIVGDQRSEKWVSSLYSYSDLYGTEYKKDEISFDSVYYHERKSLRGYKNNIKQIKQVIDKGIKEKNWTVFYFHDDSEIDTKTMEAVLDYVNQKCKSGELEAVTYKEMYEKYAQKESVIKNTNATYYVSSTGTSLVGTDEKHPMSYETAKKKTFLSGDKILLKRGDTFYGTFCPKIAQLYNKVTTISSYGTGPFPHICGYKLANKKECWEQYKKGIYQMNLIDQENFSGIQTINKDSNDIGFLEDKKGNKYHSKKASLSELKEPYDFFCDGEYIYVKANENPYEELGVLKLATKNNLLCLTSNLKVENIKISGTGACGVVGMDKNLENIQITDSIIEDIGGSYLEGKTRYGSGVKFTKKDGKNIVIQNNIIRDVYDVGIDLQGSLAFASKLLVENNVFVNNTTDLHIRENISTMGLRKYELRNNISVNQGRGWGYESDSSQKEVAYLLLEGYGIKNSCIYDKNNIIYNPVCIYSVDDARGEQVHFKNKSLVMSDYNEYYVFNQTKLLDNSYKVSQKDEFIKEYEKDTHSSFIGLEQIDENLVKKATTSNNLKVITSCFRKETTEKQ